MSSRRGFCIWLLVALCASGVALAQPERATPIREVVGVPAGALKATRAARRLFANAPMNLTVSRADAVLRELRDAGYLEARRDSLYIRADTVLLRLHPGPLYRWDSLRVTDLPPRLANDLVWPQARRRAVGFSAAQVQRRFEPVLTASAGRGYLSARFDPAGIRYHPSDDAVGVCADYRFSLGPLVRLDSLVLTNATPAKPIRESTRFIESLLRMRRGQPLEADALAAIPALLDASPYFESSGTPVLRLDSTRAVVEVPLRVRRGNRFDAVVGALPPRQGQTEWQFTGLIDLALVSPLGTGEILQLKYEELPSRSRRADTRLLLPRLFASPVDLDIRFGLLKQDSLFQTVAFDPRVSVQFTPRLSARVSYHDRSSSLLSVNAFRQTVWPPPPSLDGRSSSFGVGLTYETLDYPFNPRRGWRVVADASIGTKTVRRARGLDSLDLARLLGSQPRREWSLEGWLYLPTARNQTLVIGSRTYWLDQQERFDNDLAFVGGARLLRGFNEQQFLASFYTVATIEYRLLIERDGYVGAFLDLAYLERLTVNVSERLAPRGLGITLQLSTGAGVVSVSYAVGQAEGVPLEAGRGRIHIGYVSRF